MKNDTSRALNLGSFLRDRRGRIGPGALGNARRRTSGLRREEVAARADVSVTWYTFLEQGRGGSPSSAVLERLARALELEPADREILFLLAQHRPAPFEAASRPQVPKAVHRVLNAMTTCPAFVKTILWDVVAWNEATNVVLSDYDSLAPRQRNVLRRLFAPGVDHQGMTHWESFAGYALAAFRVDLARSPGCPQAAALVEELQSGSADFRRLWTDNRLLSSWDGTKRFDHPELGPVTLDYSSFAVDGSSGLTMVVFTPSTGELATAIGRLMAARGGRR